MNLRKFLKPYKQAGAFHSLFAPHRFVDEHVFLTKSNQLGVVLRVDGIDYECLTEETLETYTRRTAAAWRSFDEQFRIYQYVVKQDRAPVEQRSEYPNAAIERTVRQRNEHLRSKPEGLYTLQLYYSVLFEPATADNNFLRQTVSNRKVLRVLANELERNHAILMGQVLSFQRTLGDLLGITILAKQDVFAFFRLLANLDPEIAAADELKYDGHVDYYLPSLPLACTDEGIRIGKASVEVLTLKEPTTRTCPHVLRELLALESNFILCTEFKRVLNYKAVGTIRAAQNHFHWSQWVADIPSILSMVLNRGNRENVIADKSALNDVEDLDKTLARINNDGEYLGEFSFTVILYGWGNQHKLQRAASDVIKIFGNQEAALIHETYNALNAYLAVIPGNNAFNLRRTWLLSGNYADLSFLYSRALGQKTNRYLRNEYLVVLETNDRTPYYLCGHDDERFGLLIFGAPRTGKSVLANLLIDHSQKYEPRTSILDLGGSYRNITRKYDGSYLELQLGNGRQSFRINPFVLPGTKDNLQFLSSFVHILLSSSGYTATAEDERELWDALEGMYVLDAEHRTLSNLAIGLPPHMRSALQAWIGHGQYGNIFDNVEDTLTLSHFQTFDFQGMDLYPKVLEPLLFYIFQRISEVVYDPALRRTPKQLWTDETWRFLANSRARDDLMAAGASWGKHNGGIAMITQSAMHFGTAGVMKLANELCPTKILLANPGADRADYQELFHLNDKELELFATLIPKRQILVKRGGETATVLNVTLDPYAYWQYTNSAYDNEDRDQAIQEHGFEEGLKVLAAQAK